MDFNLYRSLLGQLREPEIIRLNYSGESLYYPHLVEAIELAHSTGAATELVSALGSVPDSKVEALVRSGLDRLTVSLHTADSRGYEEIYRFGSLSGLQRTIDRFMEVRARLGRTKPVLDFAFVAMKQNLGEIRSVAAYAAQLGVRELFIHPVIRRDEIPVRFDEELAEGRLRPDFRESLRRQIETVEHDYPDLRISVSNPEVGPRRDLDHQPRYFPEPLPTGARIHTCDQSPWETVHVLANGDVVVCEVREKTVMGNLATQSLRAIWRSAAYLDFRRSYIEGRAPECRACPYKMAYQPVAPLPALAAGSGHSFQLIRGWHRGDKDILWSKRASALMLDNTAQRRCLRIRGILPGARGEAANFLRVRCNGKLLGTVENGAEQLSSFEKSFALEAGTRKTLYVEFATEHVFRPSETGQSQDMRGLGFALIEIAVERAPVSTLGLALGISDLLAPLVRRFLRRGTPSLHAWRPGVSVVIPERDSPEEMIRECLTSVQAALREVAEPAEVVVVANGAPLSRYASIAGEFPAARWLHSTRHLSFATAIRRGVRGARYDWVYFLNSDMKLDPRALTEILRWRAGHVFAVSSQVFFMDPQRRREETGWTDARIQGGLVEIFDVPPDNDELTRGTLYAGGGASLFRRAVLWRMLEKRDPYAPFYWEDVEWGVRAWREGYEVLFCPRSKAWHRHRATVQRFYSQAEIGRIFRRNQLQFDLRQKWTALPRAQLVYEVQAQDEKTRRELESLWNCLRLIIARLRVAASPYEDFCCQWVRRKYYPVPWDEADSRPTAVLVSPYAIYPPTHGGAMRLCRLLEPLAKWFRIILLSDEESLYGQVSQGFFGQFSAVHLIGGRADSNGLKAERIERIQRHSHERLANELNRVAETYRADLVQIEFIELAALIERKKNGKPWVLTLHDVLLSGSPPDSSPVDIYERQLIEKFDRVIACCEEDAALLCRDGVRVVPNGASIDATSYLPSAGCHSVLFLGPFRYPPNWEGIVEFLRDVYPSLKARRPQLVLDILGGVGALQRIENEACFQQEGVRVHDHVDDVRPWLNRAALTINPIRGNRGSCLKVIESLAAGRVCVSTRQGARGFLHAGFPGLIAVETVQESGAVIERLLQDESYRLKREVPQADLLNSYSWEGSAALQRDVYLRTLCN